MVKQTDIRFTVFFSIILLVAATPVILSSGHSEGKKTSGDISFFDGRGNQLTGELEMSGAGISSGSKPDVSSISWDKVPDAKISFNALDKMNVAVNFRINGDSPQGRVILENYGVNPPENVAISAPGLPVKYVNASAYGIFFSEAEISIQYSDAELKGNDENTLVIYRYDSVSKNWDKLPASIDAGNNVLSTTINSLSIFALSASMQGKIVIRDAGDEPISGEIKIYESNKVLKKEVTASVLPAADIPERGEIEVNALKSKSLALKLRVKSQAGGEIILEDHGKKNPVAQTPPGITIKYVDISTVNLSFDSVEVRIYYSDEDLGSVDENMLVIYHWNGRMWEPLATLVDATNNMLTATTTSLSPFAASAGSGGTGRILVATDRYVVLDDPIGGSTSGAKAQSPYVLPYTGYWVITNERWGGKQTTIGAKALFMNENGTASSGKTVNFTIYYPNNTIMVSGTNTTDAAGVASYYKDLNSSKYYGEWKVRAESGGVSSNTTFIYNWWGCAWGGTSSCGNHGTRNPANYGTATANSPYTVSWEKITSRSDHSTGISADFADNYCTVCHQNYDGNPTDDNGTSADATKDFYVNDVHSSMSCMNSSCHNPGGVTPDFTNHNGGTITIGSCTSASCHPLRNDVSMKSTLNGVVSSYSNTTVSTGLYDKYHTPDSEVPCIICHGPMHNITKPDPSTGLSNNITEDTQCTTCHNNYKLHNNSVNCTLCHSDDVHAIQVFAQNATYVTLNKSNPNQARGNCTNCHQNATFFSALNNSTINPKKGNYTGRNPPLVANPVLHSGDSLAGKKWNATPGYWTSGAGSSAQLSSCRYCHGNTTHNNTALGRPSLFAGGNIVNSTISSSTYWCASCHWQGYSSGGKTYNDTANTYNFPSEPLLVPPEITGNATFGANQSITGYFNHSGVAKDDASCEYCHGNLNTASYMTGLMHNVAAGGGPDCISCHDIGKNATSRINSTAMATGIHANLNSNAINSSWAPAANKKCWGCHDSTGSQPANDSMGSRYTDPYKCYDCHNSTSKPYANVSNALNVSKHFRAGETIKAASSASDNSSSCLVCHNLTEMKVAYTEDDASGSNYSFVSHYGKNRTLDTQVRQGTGTNCSYCHQNTSTSFAVAMLNSNYNSSIQNHSLNLNSPSCNNSNCHNSGWIHNSSLTRPAFVLPNTTFCQNCHTDRQKHNNTQECSFCHVNSSSNDTIHPIKYIQAAGNYSTTSMQAANCTNCHQSALSGFTDAPLIPATLKHSANLTNGSIWGTFWQGSNSSSCYYCHNNTKHNSTALGNISSLLSDTNNSRNGSLSTTTWCVDCHYNSSVNTNYKGNQWSPLPPLITVNNTGKGYWVNHSSYLGSGYKDNNCVPCHALNGSYSSTSLNYSHSLNEGVVGGANCTACHDVGGLADAGRLVNFSAMNETGAIHKNLNSGAATTLPAENKKCWACHGNGSEPGTGHPSNYKTPYLCENCHVSAAGQNMNFTPASILNVTRHYKNSTNISTANTSSCYSCHNLSEMMLGNYDPDGPASVYDGINGGNNNSGHYGKKRTDYPSSGTNSYCYTCHNNASAVFPFIDPSNRTISNHSLTYSSTNPPCSDCHGTGRIHNDTLYRPSLSLPNSTYCTLCHGTGGSATIKNLNQHNGTVDCTQCHLNTSKSIHPARYLQVDSTWNTGRTNTVNCTTCHQSSFSGFSNAPLVPATLKHSANLTNGSIWGTFWQGSNSSSCYYCHNNTKHNSTALGNISSLLSDTNNSRNGSLSTTTWCADCHYNNSLNINYKGNQWYPTPPLITIDNTGKSYWINHSTYLDSGYKDNNCIPCHSLNGSYSSTSLNYSHSLDEGRAGGANCTSCHDVGGSAGAGRLVNFSAMNETGAIHRNLNSGAASPGGYPASNFKCWACHGNGSEPDSGHPSNYKTPYLCENCHVSAAGQNLNFTPTGILNVTQHYKNGTNISTINTSSCYSCHNISEMMLGNYDPDGPASVYGGINGGNNNSGHYGKKRADYPSSGTNSYCYICHNNASTVFPFIDSNNKTISNHSTTYPATNPACSSCHGTGRIHNSTLYKSSLTLPNSTYCTTCHTTKQQHNGTVNCTQCHLNTSNSIHPARYLQTDSTWNTGKTNAVNCTNCHQSSFSGFSNAPLIPITLKHSANLTNGSIWGTFWQGSNSSSCYYCHNNTKHNNTALGNISSLLSDTNNSRNGSLSTTTWCADCHYNSSVNVNYKGNQWFPLPPLITVDNTGKSYWINHSSYLGSGYKDNNCVPCHALNGSYSSTSLNYSHSLNEGGVGGANCTACHDVGGLAGAGRLVNFSAMNETGAIHKNLNSGVATSLPAENKKCWACHGNGSEPGSGHPSNYMTPYLCEDCHVPAAGQNMNFTPASILNVTQHYRNGTNISTTNTSSCYSCHNLSEMMLGNYDPDGPASVYGGINGGNNNSGHYGKKRTDYPSSGTNSYCYTCHNNASTVFPFIDSNNKTISNHSTTYPATNPPCSDCHGTGRIHNSTLYKPSLTLPNSTYCTTCHTTKQQHNGTVNCTQCHLNTSRGIHPARYLQADTTWNTARTNAVNCTTCHQSLFSGFDAPLIPATFKHSANLTNGSTWGTFWQGSNSSSCYYCHNNTKHNSTALGNVSSLLLDTNNSRNGSLSTTTWCADCHYNSSVNTNYKGNQWSPAPPLITVDNTGKTYWVNHSTYLDSGYKDNNCIPCHSLNNSGTYSLSSLNYSHSLDEGRSGGANCTSCHDVGGSAGSGRLVNFSAMNETGAIHKNLNSGATSPGGYPASNSKCWACHGNGSEPGSSHPSNYKTPYLCENCHVPAAGQNMNFTPSSILNVTQHYRNGTNISTANTSSCYSCHNLSEMMLGNYDPDGPASVYGGINGGNNNSGHYGKKRTDYPSSGTNSYCYTCHNNASTVFPFIDINNKTIANHSTTYPATNPACSSCHGTGRIHNSTLYKPSLSLPNSTYCTTCHTSKQQHNGTVNCTQCHLNTSNSIHPVRYLQADTTWNTTKTSAINCTDCHQSSFSGFSNAPLVPVALKHSANISNGSIWGTFWQGSNSSSCYYCHNNTKHNSTALGNVTALLSDTNNSRNGSLSTTTWCADCHYNSSVNTNYKGSQWSPVPPLITVDNTGKSYWVNHSTYLDSGYKDNNCIPCHALNGSYSYTSLNYSHSLDEGRSGGANCTSCHDVGGLAGAGRLVNFSAMNDSSAIHRNLNTGAATTLPAENKKCWACHGNGSEPGSSHPSNYKTPYLCENCHVPSAGQNMNFTPASILNVTQHYRNGTNISTVNTSSCYSCHNLSEMMLGNYDPDGPASVYGGINGGNNNSGHYGKKRIDYPSSGTSSYCYTCHNNASAIFPFIDSNNKTIANHSTAYPSTNPACSDCHGTGRIHNSTLYKPFFLVPNSTYCTSCHGTGGSATIKNLNPHNGTINCTQCHLNTSRSIHPARYLQADTTWNTARTNAVNCTTCHQSTFSDFNAPLIPATLKHSSNLTNGSIWGAFWQGSNSSSCYYCHNNTKHNSTALGNVSSLLSDTNNSRNGSLSTTTWCADCHYNSSVNTNYKGSQWSPVPPLITVDNTGKSYWTNHSTYLDSGYKDNNCIPCHALNGSYSSTSLNYSHSLDEGRAGGANCTSCHDVGGSAGAGRLVNFSAMNDSSAIHRNLNTGAATTLPAENKKCWACHGNGSEPGSSHPSNYKTPYLCEDCHVPEAGQNRNFTPSGILNVTQHYRNGTNISTANTSSCYSCHNKSEMMLGNYDPDGPGSVYGGINGGNNNSGHYGKKRTDYPSSGTNGYCYTCHNNASTVFPFIDTGNKTISNHSTAYPSTNPACSDCHGTGRIHNSTLYKPSLTLPNSTYCTACHTTKQQHNGTVNCTQCHLNTSKSIHPARYLQADTTWNTVKTSAVNCTTCHQSLFLSFTDAPLIPATLKHSSNFTNGSIWGTFWQGSNSSLCYYCHNNTKHNSTALGNVSNLLSDANNSRNGSLSTTTWCSDCHYNASINTNYKGNQWSPAPPLITVDNTGKTYWVNHSTYLGSGYKDNNCVPCHSLNGSYSSTSLNYSHSLSEGVVGGANCTACHDVGGLAGSGKLVNFSAMNETGAIHRNLNIGATSPGGYPESNFKCWACHGNGSEPGTSHPSNYKTPYLCENCHIPDAGQNMNFTPASILNVTQHYRNGTNISTVNASSCYSCHNLSEMMLGNYDPDGPASVYDGINGGNNNSGHYGKKRTDYPTQDTNSYCYKCHDNASTIFPFIDSNNRTIANHSTAYPTTNPACSDCHGTGRIHNSTLYKPYFSLPNSTYCTSCHGTGGSATIKNLNLHNGTVNCTQCHLNTSRSIHPARYLQTDSAWNTGRASAVNCTTCHQSSFSGFTDAPIIPATLKHSVNLTNGSIWSTFWQGSNSSSCYYCHNNTKHNSTALGNVSNLLSDTNNSRNGSLSMTTWCADCHYNSSVNVNYKGNQWAPSPPLITVDNTGKSYWVNHSTYLDSGYKDNNCVPCHALKGSYSSTSLNYSHSLDEGRAGGANCTSCHDVGGSAGTGRLVNFSAMNETGAIHKNLNSGATSPGGYPASNFKCWACHGNGSEPGSSHPSNYKIPYLCESCHVPDSGQNMNFTPASILNVTQHYRNGTNISTANTSSCYSCHNKSEMMLGNYDPDGPGSVYGGINGGNNNSGHYGKKRTDYPSSGTNSYCYTCHNNASTIFPFINANNKTISNHSLTYSSTNPPCSDCHGTGRIHNSTLYKPSFSLPNSTYCTACHTTKQQHNGTVNCTQCHLNTSGSIHPARYLQADTTWNTARTNAVNCTTCHQSLFSGFDAPLIPATFKHSANLTNGSTWGTFWQGSNSSSCYYCHNNTKHNSTALGNVSSLLSDINNSRNSSLSTTIWCADCHYNSSVNTNYKGSQWSPVPPLITVDNTGKSYWVNHSTYLDSGYKDNNCIPCHSLNNSGTYSSTSLNYSHSLNEGVSGGANCTLCHDVGGSAGAGRLVNFSAMNETGAIHKNLNIGVTSPGGYSAGNFKCWACHGNGSEPGSSHPSNYKTPYLCEDCHVPAAGQNMNFTPSGILNVTQHYKNGTNVSTANTSSCYSCHNKSEMMLGTYDPDGPGSVYGGMNGGNNNSGHYGKKRTDYPSSGTNSYCYTCHNNASTVFPFIDINNKTIANHSTTYPATNPACSSCHGTGRIHNSTLYKSSLTLPNSTYCTTCHTTKQQHNGTVNCTQCHLNTSKSIHPARYIESGGLTWSTTKTNAANCSNCHQSLLPGFTNTPVIPALKHSVDTFSGQKWGSYWDNTSIVTACYYCHQNETHKANNLLGNISSIKGSNTYNNPTLSNSTWCINCHYASASQYNGSILSPIPPEITNSSLSASDGTVFYNHSGLSGFNDSICKDCHGGALSGYLETTLNFSHSVSEGGGGPDCIGCHDAAGSGAPDDKRVKVSYIKLGVHKNLNSNATNTTAIDPVNKACWACHGEGSEPSGHPERYRTPRECSNNDCHSLIQSFKAPMVYSHFKDAGLNSNPGNITNYNVSVRASCESCHSNSIATGSDSLNLNASVSHYATRDNLVDSINCIYCHLNQDNSEKWGNATEINKNRTAMIEMDRIRNKFTAQVGEFVELGLGYRLRIKGISDKRGSAIFELYGGNDLLDAGLINIGEYVYEEDRIINNSSTRIPIIVLNITGMFLKDNNEGFIQFEGSRIKRLHPENRTTSCYRCHFTGGTEKHKYTVMDRDDDYIFYTEVLINSSDRKEYDQEKALQILATKTSSDIHIDIDRAQRKTLKKGEKWKLAENYVLDLKDVAQNSDSALFVLDAGGNKQTNIVRKGDTLEHRLMINYLGYTYSNITIFRAKVSEIMQPDIVVLENIVALSPEIIKIKVNSSVYGYNASWLWENNTFMTGRIPENIHSPLFFDGRDGGADCTSCHNMGDLGFHKNINQQAKSTVSTASKACWACHGEGTEPRMHPINYKQPKDCKSCHVERKMPFYNATYIGDEKHSAIEDCRPCHIVGTHKVIRFQVTPGIKEISLSENDVQMGEKVILNATAASGYAMSIRGAEYYIDSPSNTFPMIAVDGSFDERVEEMAAEIDTAGLKPGEHLIFVRAKERNDRWGSESSITLVVKEKESSDKGSGKMIPEMPGILSLVILIFITKIIYRKKRI